MISVRGITKLKRRDLIELFEAKGWQLKRHGNEHDIYTDGKHIEAIPRHREIDERLAKAIIRKWGL